MVLTKLVAVVARSPWLWLSKMKSVVLHRDWPARWTTVSKHVLDSALSHLPLDPVTASPQPSASSRPGSGGLWLLLTSPHINMRPLTLQTLARVLQGDLLFS